MQWRSWQNSTALLGGSMPVLYWCSLDPVDLQSRQAQGHIILYFVLEEPFCLKIECFTEHKLCRCCPSIWVCTTQKWRTPRRQQYRPWKELFKLWGSREMGDWKEMGWVPNLQIKLGYVPSSYRICSIEVFEPDCTGNIPNFLQIFRYVKWLPTLSSIEPSPKVSVGFLSVLVVTLSGSRPIVVLKFDSDFLRNFWRSGSNKDSELGLELLSLVVGRNINLEKIFEVPAILVSRLGQKTTKDQFL